MPRTLMLVPTNVGVGLTTVALGLVRAIDHHGVQVGFYKPVTQRHDSPTEQAVRLVSSNSTLTPTTPLDTKHVEALLSAGRRDDLLEQMVERFQQSIDEADVVVVQGLVSTPTYPYADQLNVDIAKALGAEVIFVAAQSNLAFEKQIQQIEIKAREYGGLHHQRVLGCIFNKINAPIDKNGYTRLDLTESIDPDNATKFIKKLNDCALFKTVSFKLLGAIVFDTKLIAPRVQDLIPQLKAKVVHAGNMHQRRILRVTLCARGVANMIDGLKSGTLVITSGDRVDIILATAMAALSGINIAGLLLTGNYDLPETVQRFCQQAMDTGLPILSVNADSFRTAINIHNFNLNVPLDDKERIETVKDHVAQHINEEWIKTLVTENVERRLSPAAFRYLLTDKARRANKKIVLPEGDEPRTVQAASICAARGIAQPVLIGKPSEIKRIAEINDIELPDSVQIIDPARVRNKYVPMLVQLREHKGMTKLIAKQQLEDNVMLGTMMLQQGEVDGLVSGAVHTTANTIRPALQLIKTAENAQIVSSVFFMCMPEQVLVYGDCAVNPNPNAEQLADIAIQSADSAKAFGIEPRVAMISYSTGTSGAGSDVEKVRHATEIVKQLRPDILIDGPLQYDAALIEKVAQTKAPDSEVAGRATVIIFPDLNTGNTTYKAVQRSANVLSIGPMLQGLRKPVNDLSRGATVDDIVFTIAITAIQAG